MFTCNKYEVLNNVSHSNQRSQLLKLTVHKTWHICL